MPGHDTDQRFTHLHLSLTRPPATTPGPFPNQLRQLIEAIIWTLKLGPEQHGVRVPLGLWTRTVQRLLALNTAIWHN